MSIKFMFVYPITMTTYTVVRVIVIVISTTNIIIINCLLGIYYDWIKLQYKCIVYTIYSIYYLVYSVYYIVYINYNCTIVHYTLNIVVTQVAYHLYTIPGHSSSLNVVYNKRISIYYHCTSHIVTIPVR